MHNRRGRILGVALFAMGVSAFVTQITLMREMLGALSGNELVLGIVLGTWMLLTGAGATLARIVHRAPGATGCSSASATTNIPPTDPRPATMAPDVMIVGQLLIAMLPIAGVFLLRALWNHVFVRGAAVGVPESVAVSLVLLAPYCLVTGYLLTWTCRTWGEQAGSAGIGAVYFLDSLGGLAGGLAFSFVLVRWLGPFELLYCPAAVSLLAALALAWGFRRTVWLGVVLVAAVGLGALIVLVDADAISTRLQYPGQEVVYWGHSPYGRLVVTRSASQYNFIENGVPLFSTQNAQAVEETVHYALAQRPGARRVLLLSGGVSGTAREILKYPVEAVDYVELDPLVLDVARRLLPASLADPRIHTLQTDGRRFVERTAQTYDVVIVDVPAPSTFQLNRFYTREFMGAVAARLRPGGVLSFSLGQYDDYMSPQQARLVAATVSTLRGAFRHVLLLPGARLFFLGSDGPLTPDVAAAIEARGLSTRFVKRDYLAGMFTPDRLAEVQRAAAAAGPVNDDFNPILCYYHLLHWMQQFEVRFGLLEGLLAALLLVYVARLRPVPLVIFTGGFAASALEVVLLMGYQILYGSTYQQMSVIVTMFMLGLGGGALLMNRQLARRTRSDLAWLQLALAVLALAVPLVLVGLGHFNRLFPHLDWIGQMAIPALTLALATAVGMEFPLAAQLDFRSATATGAGLYTADYVGAAVGALLVSTLLVPTLGVFGVAGLAAALCIASVVYLKVR